MVVNLANSIFNTSTKSVPSNSPTIKLSAGNIAKQQALSNKYGIPTFTPQGGLSTIPTDLKFSNIFEGFGNYGDAASFKQAVVDKVSQDPSAYNVTVTQNPQGSPTVTIPDPTQPQRTFNIQDPTTPLVETTGSNSLGNQISSFVKNNKALVIGSAVVVVALLVFGGGRRR